jgi:hypothetical protein
MVVLDLEQGLYFSLDEVGTAIWEGFVEGQSFEMILRVLAAKYEVAEHRLLADGEALVAKLLEAGLLVATSDVESQ